MSKTLSESAAEILKASLASAGKDPTKKLPGEEDDLGGATESDPAGGEVGKKAAASVKEAPKPTAAKTGAPVDPTKKLASEEAEASTEEVEQIDEISAGLAKRYIDKAADDMGSLRAKSADQSKQSYTASNVTDYKKEKRREGINRAAKNYLSPKIKVEDVEVDEDTISEEEILEAKKQMKMDMVAKHKGSMAEDVDALFNGESLSEEFRTKATTIFEAAVQSRVEKIVEDVINDNDEVLAEAVEEIKTDLASHVDEYLNYVVEQWMETNAVAIESGLRAELADDFISGLKNLFAEHYIDIPDEKLEVAEELAAKVVEMEESVAAREEQFAALTKELNEAKKYEAIRKICEGLTEVQVGKMKSLAEGVEFTTEGEFNNKLAVIRENYFPSKKLVSEVKVSEETSTEQPEVAVPAYMDRYVKAISKSLPK